MREFFEMFRRKFLYETPCISDIEFEDKLKAYLRRDGIYAYYEIDKLMPLVKSCGESSKVAILERYQKDRALYEELLARPRRPDVSARIVAPAEPHYAMRAGAGSGIAMAPVEWSDFDAGGDLYKLIPFLKTPADPGDDLQAKLMRYGACVGSLMASGVSIGTAFLISPSLIVTTRHCLNGIALGELEIKFDFIGQKIRVAALVESGAVIGLDYVVLRLGTEVACKTGPVFIPMISYDRSQKTCFTFVGYDEDEELSFTNYRASELHSYGIVGAYQDSVQETGFGFSGSPYFDEHGRVYALHQNTGLDKKQSLYFSEICERNKDSLFNLQSDLWEFMPDQLTHAHAVFSVVSFSEAFQYDEGRARGLTLGKNPSVKEDYLGKDNIVCKEVLYRWALRNKARYVGAKPNRRDWIEDWKNWEVKIKKTDAGAREWVRLDTTRDRERLAIQMGHKLSAVSYWVYGYNLLTNIILKEFFEMYEKVKGKAKADAKKAKYAARYGLFSTPGFKQVESGQAVVNRQFMYSSSNYRFEWAALNEEHGREESSMLTYEEIKNCAALWPLNQYRKERNDRATTPVITTDLANRKASLTAKIAANSARFTKK